MATTMKKLLTAITLVVTLAIFFAEHISLLQPAEASGFMQWSRRYRQESESEVPLQRLPHLEFEENGQASQQQNGNGRDRSSSAFSTSGMASANDHIFVSASSAGVVVVNTRFNSTNNPQPSSLPFVTQILNSTTGEVLVAAAHEEHYDASAVIRPAETPDGKFVCEMLVDGTRRSVGTSADFAARRSGGIEGNNRNIISDPSLILFCGVYLMSLTNASAAPAILFPNGTLYKFPAPVVPQWTCSEASPCQMKGAEQQEGQMGGCHRQSHPSPYLPNFFPPESSLVLVADSKNVFLFRPLDFASRVINNYHLAGQQQQQHQESSTDSFTADYDVKILPRDQWNIDGESSSDSDDENKRSDPISGDASASSLFSNIDLSFRFLSLPYMSFPSAAPRQAVICALVMININGNMTLFDADRDNSSTITGLPLLGTAATPHVGRMEEEESKEKSQMKKGGKNLRESRTDGVSSEDAAAVPCIPFVQSVMKLAPSETASSATVNPIYLAVLAVQCSSDGTGFLWDAVMTENDPKVSLPSEPVTMDLLHCGKYTAPANFTLPSIPTSSSTASRWKNSNSNSHASSPSLSAPPLITGIIPADITITLVQPAIQFKTNQSSVAYASHYVAYVTSIAVHTFVPMKAVSDVAVAADGGDDAGASAPPPPPPVIGTMVFTSGLGSKSFPYPALTKTQVASAVASSIEIDLGFGPSPYNITNKMGWIVTKVVPAGVMANLTTILVDDASDDETKKDKVATMGIAQSPTRYDISALISGSQTKDRKNIINTTAVSPLNRFSAIANRRRNIMIDENESAVQDETDAMVSSIVRQTARWLGTFGTVYSVFSHEFTLFVNASTGQCAEVTDISVLAEPSPSDNTTTTTMKTMMKSPRVAGESASSIKVEQRREESHDRREARGSLRLVDYGISSSSVNPSSVAAVDYDGDGDDSQYGLYGGVMLVRPTRLNPYSSIAYFPHTVDWQDVVPLIDPTAPPSMYSTHIVATTPSPLSPSEPMCIYTLRNHVGGVTSQVVVNVMLAPKRKKNSDIIIDFDDAMKSGVADNSNNLTWQWNALPGQEVLLYPFTQNYCTVSVSPFLPSVIPAGDTIVIGQEEGENTRIAAIPLRDVVSMTAQVSYLLTVNVSETPNRRLETLHPIGTRMIYVCDVFRLMAYSNIIGNLSWSYNFSSLPGCSQCVCSEQDTSLLLSSDRNYIVLRVMNQSQPADPRVTKPIFADTYIIVHAQDGTAIDYFNTSRLEVQSSECDGELAANITFGQMTEITQAAPQYAFLGVAVMPNTRCFAVIALQTSEDEDGDVFFDARAYVFFFLGSSAQFDSDNVAWHDDSLFISNVDNFDGITDSTLGHNVWAFSVSQMVGAFTPLPISIGALPTFAASNVLSSIAYGSLWFAAQAKSSGMDYIAVTLSAYDTSALSTSLWTIPLDIFFFTDVSDVILSGVFIVRNKFVCAATGGLWCLPIDAALGDVLHLEGDPNPHFGIPAVDQWGAMIFATPPYTIHAVRFAASDYAPTHLWTTPWWPGFLEDVDLNINITTCTDPQLSDELLLVICSPTYDPRGTEYQRHMFLLDSDTGEVMLGNGPWAKPGMATFSDNGLLLIYVNNLATAVSLELVGTVIRIPINFNGDLCRAEADANYAISINASGIVAKMIPWNASLPWIVRNFTSTLYAQQAIGYRDLKLGKTFVLVDSSVMFALWDALSPTVQAQGSINIFVGETVSIMTADFGRTLMDASLCVLCQIGCPDYCALDFATGDQFSYQFAPTHVTMFEKPYRSHLWRPHPKIIGDSFSGNVSLDLYRFWSLRKSQQQTVECYNDTSASSVTQIAPSGRFCLQTSRQSYKKWVVVQISLNSTFAVTTTYSSLWSALRFTSVSTSQLEEIFSVAGDIGLANMVESGMVAGSFPNDLVTGESIGDILAIANDVVKNVSKLVVTAKGGAVVVLDNNTCAEMDEDLPVCDHYITFFDYSRNDEDYQTVFWSRTGGSNWGDGFVKTGFETNLARLMRTTSQQAPESCSVATSNCYAQCHPTTSCGSQLTGLFSTILYVLAWLPEGSTLPYPAVANESCFHEGFSPTDAILRQIFHKSHQKKTTVNGSSGGYSGVLRSANAADSGDISSGGGDYPLAETHPDNLRVSFFCSKGKRIYITLAVDGSADARPIVMADVTSARAQSYIGAKFECTYCTYFLLQGVIAEPFGWLAVGAVKSLVVCILFYWMMEKVKERQRHMNELNRKWKRHDKQKRMILTRMAVIKAYNETQENEGAPMMLQEEEDADESAYHMVTMSYLNRPSLRASTRPMFYQPKGSIDNTATTLFSASRLTAGGGGGGGNVRDTLVNMARSHGGGASLMDINTGNINLVSASSIGAGGLLPHHVGSLQRASALGGGGSAATMLNRASHGSGNMVTNAAAGGAGSGNAVATANNNNRHSSFDDMLNGANYHLNNGNNNTITNMSAFSPTENNLLAVPTSPENPADSARGSSSRVSFDVLTAADNRMHKPAEMLTEEERRDEMSDLKKRLAALNVQINADRQEEEAIEKKRWRISRWLSNPIDIYAAIVVRLSRFRRDEERRVQMGKIVGNFVYKEFSPDSLVEMLAAILGESEENRPQVIAFAHFYQWNLCDNRQWVVREHVDEQSQYASVDVIDGLEHELQLVHNDLQDLYVWYKLAFGDEISMMTDTTKPYLYDFTDIVGGAGNDGVGTGSDTDDVDPNDALLGGDGSSNERIITAPTLTMLAQAQRRSQLAFHNNNVGHGSPAALSYQQNNPMSIPALGAINRASVPASELASAPLLLTNSGGVNNSNNRTRPVPIGGGGSNDQMNGGGGGLTSPSNKKGPIIPSASAANNSGGGGGISPSRARRPTATTNTPPTNSTSAPMSPAEKEKAAAEKKKVSRRDRLNQAELRVKQIRDQQALEQFQRLTGGLGGGDSNNQNQNNPLSHFGNINSDGSAVVGGGAANNGNASPETVRDSAAINRTDSDRNNNKANYNTDHPSAVTGAPNANNAARYHNRHAAEKLLEKLNKETNFAGMDAFVVNPNKQRTNNNNHHHHHDHHNDDKRSVISKARSAKFSSAGGGGGAAKDRDHHPHHSNHHPKHQRGEERDVGRTRESGTRVSGTRQSGHTRHSHSHTNRGIGKNNNNKEAPATTNPVLASLFGGGDSKKKSMPRNNSSFPTIPDTNSSYAADSSPRFVGDDMYTPQTNSAETGGNQGGFPHVDEKNIPTAADDDYDENDSNQRFLRDHDDNESDCNYDDDAFDEPNDDEYYDQEQDELLEEGLEKAIAKHNLRTLVDEFTALHERKPHCFEYASLPSRKIDDKLLPSPLLVVFSLLETLVTLCIYTGNVLVRSYEGNNGIIRPFDMYQCVFFLVFNSSLPSSLIVNVIARADLGKTTHTKNALEKVKDIVTNPFVIMTLMMLGIPMATHIIPGFVVFIWLMAPALGLAFAAEYYLRTRITVQSHFVVLGRLATRVLILLTVSISLSLSYNYSASFIWSTQTDDGYLSSGSYKKTGYFDIIVQDYNSRSFSCTYNHIVDAIANFVQMGFFFL